MFRIYNGTIGEKYLLFTVSNRTEFDKRISTGFYQNYTMLILNEKNEYCDSKLNVIPRPDASMESMVGLLQGKFQSKSKKK